MQSGNDTINFLDTIRSLVIKSLSKSIVWKKIADYLFEISPSGSYTSEIAYKIKTTPTNVIGAIRGMSSRYKNDESLLNLKIVEQIDGSKNIKVYKITEFWKEILQIIEERS